VRTPGRFLERRRAEQIGEQDLAELPDPTLDTSKSPDVFRIVGRNASKAKPAKFLVFLVKNEGAPVLVPQR